MSATRILGIVALALVLLVAGLRLFPKDGLSAASTSSTAIYDARGRLLRLTVSDDQKYRLYAPIEQISPVLVELALLHEDRYFFWHFGFNPVSLVRGAWETYAGGGPRQGGSTITMQLARLHWKLNTRSPPGKCRQVLLAILLELRYSKREILEAYLNAAPFSNNIEGAGAASLIYFGKRADRLTLQEALLLAVIPQSPQRRVPADGALVALDARARLFARYAAHHADARAQAELVRAPLALRRAANLPFIAPHLTDMLLREHRRGGELHATVDARLQRVLERHVRRYVDRQRRFGIENASAMLLDFRTMEVKAVVGSANFLDPAIQGQVNGTLAKRSPGSTLKPFLYALAMDQGVIHPLSVLKDAPTTYGAFSPENFDGRFVGPITARDALIRSRNIPAVSISTRVFHPSFYDWLKNAGISDLMPEDHYGLALALGGAEMTMEELATLYATLGNGGVERPLRYRRSDPTATGRQLLSPEAVFMTLDILKDNPRPDRARIAGMQGAPVYWKTGTSWGFRDAWTAGLFGPYVLVVWAGNFNGQGNPALVGIQAAAPLFFEIVDSVRAQVDDPWELLRVPPHSLAEVEVCAASGDLPNAYCPLRAKTWFIPGKSPIRVSDVHRPVAIDPSTGTRACLTEAGSSVRIEVYEFWPSDMLRLFQLAGMPRKIPPPFPADCAAAGDGAQGSAPQIRSPLRGATYTLRPSQVESSAVPLEVTADGDVREVYWFVNDSFIGKAKPRTSYAWTPDGPGAYTLRVVDDQGRSDARQLRVAVSN
jgi:penicillin-binding protein 1C